MTWFVLVYCVGIFALISCDLSDFLYPKFPLLKKGLLLSRRKQEQTV